jgi:hypothetical protein
MSFLDVPIPDFPEPLLELPVSARPPPNIVPGYSPQRAVGLQDRQIDPVGRQAPVWPLPPEGTITFVAEGPAYGIAESTIEVDATEIRARARRPGVLWPV